MPTEISGSTGVNKIQDGTVVNADINNSAAIAGSKLVMPTGSVLQVVSANTNTEHNQGGTSYADTGLTCAITPSSSSSKILILVAQVAFFSVDTTSERTAFVRLYRDIGAAGAEMVHREYVAKGPTQVYDLPLDISFQYLDSPNSTASVSYRTQTKLSGTTSDIKTQAGSSYSNMTLMEIAG